MFSLLKYNFQMHFYGCLKDLVNNPRFFKAPLEPEHFFIGHTNLINFHATSKKYI